MATGTATEDGEADKLCFRSGSSHAWVSAAWSYIHEVEGLRTLKRPQHIPGRYFDYVYKEYEVWQADWVDKKP